MDSTDRIVYLQGFLQAYGLDKEAFIFPPTPDKEHTHGKNPATMSPPAPAFMNSQARKKMFTKGFNLNFENPSVQKLTTKFAPDRAKFLSQRFTGPQSWKQRALGGLYTGAKKLGLDGPIGRWIAESDNPYARRATKALYTSSPEARKDIQAGVNEKVRTAYAPYLKGALGAAAIGIPMMMMMRGGGQQQQAKTDPRTVELQRHAAAMKPGAVYRLGSGGGNSGGYSSGRSQVGGGRSWRHG